MENLKKINPFHLPEKKTTAEIYSKINSNYKKINLLILAAICACSNRQQIVYYVCTETCDSKILRRLHSSSVMKIAIKSKNIFFLVLHKNVKRFMTRFLVEQFDE